MKPEENNGTSVQKPTGVELNPLPVRTRRMVKSHDDFTQNMHRIEKFSEPVSLLQQAGSPNPDTQTTAKPHRLDRRQAASPEVSD